MRILFADAFEDSGLEALRSDGFDLDYRPQLDASALSKEVGGADVLVVRSTKVGAEVFEAGGPLGLVIRAGAGHNTIDSDAAAKRAVFVANVPGKNSVAVAELTLGLILALDRRIADNVTDTRSGAWNKKVYSQSDGLMGKTLGIIGLGQIGLAVAERAKSFGLRVIAERKDRDQATLERMKELEVETVPDQSTLLSSADIVSIHVPGSSKTKNLVNAEFLAGMRPGSILINTSRGDVVDEAALLAAIAEKNLRVGIDVFADEPAGGTGEFQSALAQHPQVYATHHIGASTAQAQEAIASEVVAMIRDYRRGVARNVVNLTPPEGVGSILVVRHFDRVGVLSAVLGALREAGLNVQEMQNQVFAGAGASVATIQVEGDVGEAVLGAVRQHRERHLCQRPSVSWLEPVEAGLVEAVDAGEVISPAYDLLTPTERWAHGRLHPRSFLNCTPSEGDDPELDYRGRRRQAQRYLADEIERGTWTFRPPCFYLLQLESGGHRQIGIVGDVGGDRFPGFIKPHEETRTERVDDLADYLETVSYGSSPVGLAYQRSHAVDEVVAATTAMTPVLEITLEGGDRQKVWVVGEPTRLASALDGIRAAYIIDGHHRVAATLRRGVSPKLPGGRFLAVAFPHDDLAVFPFHRWIDADLAPTANLGRDLVPRPGLAVAVTREGEWELQLGSPDEVEVDSARLSRQVLRPLGVEDERTDPRLAFIPGYPGPEALRRLVDERGGVGFMVAPATIEDVIAFSERGENMPPKATFFSPKPRSGVFLVRR